MYTWIPFHTNDGVSWRSRTVMAPNNHQSTVHWGCAVGTRHASKAASNCQSI